MTIVIRSRWIGVIDDGQSFANEIRFVEVALYDLLELRKILLVFITKKSHRRFFLAKIRRRSLLIRVSRRQKGGVANFARSRSA